jgi:hypothetical protein
LKFPFFSSFFSFSSIGWLMRLTDEVNGERRGGGQRDRGTASREPRGTTDGAKKKVEVVKSRAWLTYQWFTAPRNSFLFQWGLEIFCFLPFFFCSRNLGIFFGGTGGRVRMGIDPDGNFFWWLMGWHGMDDGSSVGHKGRGEEYIWREKNGKMGSGFWFFAFFLSFLSSHFCFLW